MKCSRSFRSDEAKAEEPERTLFVSSAERIGLLCHDRHVLSSRQAIRAATIHLMSFNGTFHDQF